MNYRAVSAALGLLIGLISLFMLPALGWSLWYQDHQFWEWIGSILIAALLGGGLWIHGRHGRHRIQQREALAIVGLGWIVAAAIGAIPMVLCGAVPSYTDAFFETMSGFTTTGSTILTDIESTAHSVLFWRSTTHWLGGIGIIVIFVAILPFYAGAGRRLYQSEIPGVAAEGLTPRIKQTAMLLLKIYVVLSLAECILLMLGGMNLFDALCHTFGTMATGGFSTKNASILHFRQPQFHSLFIEIVIIVFMFLAGCNFTLHYFFARGKWMTHLKDVEFRAYAMTLVITSLIIIFLVWLVEAEPTPGESIRSTVFTTVSIMTTTGFCTANFDTWPDVTRALLVLLMFVGGCGGSTGGGIKVIRFVVLFRSLFTQVERIHSPHTVRQVKLAGRIFDEGLQFTVLNYFFAIMVITGLATLVLTLLEPQLGLVSAFTAVAATINNIGPGLARVGAIENFAFLHASSKWLLSLCMVIGRLELFSIMVLFAPSFWRRY